MTSPDVNGRLADRSPLQVLGWTPRLPLKATMIGAVVVLVPCAEGPERVTRQGHIRLTVSAQRTLGIVAGDPLFVAASVHDDQLTIYPMWVVDAALTALHQCTATGHGS
ncbi:hypothetical protein ACFFX1_34130 [Dactylosporangium sucinum]|uniref:hypothetical protein n=1 Tax=Dactylosporangium sucinum TaxID=1424081 RepID=UPI00167E11EF|nr:hypothetical protein [Dactylosporangium sucinum]